ncbi:MAG: hypothetical protein K6E40_00035 [Desulfovibrio sp.]|nr:hypothetical protein [Desulfovibrio sp.]
METERTHRWTFADPVVLLKRLALAKGRPLILRIDSADGWHASAAFPLKGIEDTIVTALVHTVP